MEPFKTYRSAITGMFFISFNSKLVRVCVCVYPNTGYHQLPSASSSSSSSITPGCLFIYLIIYLSVCLLVFLSSRLLFPLSLPNVFILNVLVHSHTYLYHTLARISHRLAHRALPPALRRKARVASQLAGEHFACVVIISASWGNANMVVQKWTLSVCHLLRNMCLYQKSTVCVQVWITKSKQFPCSAHVHVSSWLTRLFFPVSFHSAEHELSVWTYLNILLNSNSILHLISVMFRKIVWCWPCLSFTSCQLWSWSLLCLS